MQPLFSILHTSARPDQWRKVYDAWIAAAVNPDQVEYVLCVDERWGFYKNRGVINTPLWMHEDWEYRRGESTSVEPSPHRLNRLTWNTSRRCYVDGVNTAAKASTGRILIVNADDQYPCEGWDLALLGMLNPPLGQGPTTQEQAQEYYQTSGVLDRDFAIEVSTGTPDEHARRIMVMPILSRARYERLGYVFYPEYESMFADNEFCEHAQQDGVVIDARRLMFPHKHYLFDDSGKWRGKEESKKRVDAAYLAQNRPEAYELGEPLFKARRQERFDPTARHDIQKAEPAKEQRTLALCISGESFHWEWVHALLRLHTYLGVKGYQVWTGREYTSNVYVTREQIRKVMMEQDPKPDLFLWIDDDNPAPTPEQFEFLLKDLEQHPEIDGVSGWCWIYNTQTGVMHPSCGMSSPDGLRWRPFNPVFFPKETEPRLLERTGFPCFLMKRSALEKAGNRPFLPILDDSFDHGLSGEDLAFCIRALENGAIFMVDPRVRVQHLKITDAVPNTPEVLNLPDPKIAVMMRVKNEARWIDRCIQSVIPLAGENVFVLDDESTDGTCEIARGLGVNTYSDPFPGEPLDEIRDKEWLLTQVKAACDPDWILCIDGDEELEPDGAEMLRRIVQTAPPDVDVFALNFLFLWDSVDQIRVDGRFSSLGRESLFRAKGTGIHFKSYYEVDLNGTQNPNDPKCHVGLHCGNAPVTDGRKSAINVNLLHYGYILREDRIRKYNWYRNLDPDNPYEDNYRHIVLGDLPELPATLTLPLGGPLKLVKLTPRMVPKFAKPLEPLRDGPSREDSNLLGATPVQAINLEPRCSPPSRPAETESSLSEVLL